jgi:hypothetical protein
VIGVMVEGVNSVSEQAMMSLVWPADCEQDSDREAVAVVLPSVPVVNVPVVSPVRFPVNSSVKLPAVVVVVGVMTPTNSSALNENVKVPLAPAVVGTETVKPGLTMPVGIGIVKVLSVAVDPLATSKFPDKPPVSSGEPKVLEDVRVVNGEVFIVAAPPGPVNVNDPLAIIAACA